MKLVKLSDEQREIIQKIELEVLTELDRICKKHNIKYVLAYGTLIGAVRHQGFIPWDDDVDVMMKRDDLIKFRQICKEELDAKFFYQSHDTDPEYFYLFDKIRVDKTIFKETFLAERNIHHGIYIDIFPLDYIEDNRWKRFWQVTLYKFFRIGLNSKYINIKARHGKKKVAAILGRVLFALCSEEWLYDIVERIATSYEVKKRHLNQEIGYLADSSKCFAPENIYFDVKEMDFEGKKFCAPSNYDIILKTMYGDYMCFPSEEQRCTIHDLVELDYSQYLI